MAPSRVLCFFGLGLLIGLIAAQCPNDQFKVPHTPECCANSFNTGGLFGGAKCCRDADANTCYCAENAELVGDGCTMITTTAAPTTPAPTGAAATVTTTAPAASTTAGSTTASPPAGDTTTAAPMDTAPPTTTEPPTTTPTPLCPPPAPVQRLLNSQVVGQCVENGLVAFYFNGSFTRGQALLGCHGAYVYNPSSKTREIITTQHCWIQISSVYEDPDITVTGVFQRNEFPVKNCFIKGASVSFGKATIMLTSILQWYLDDIGDKNGCSAPGCIVSPTIRPNVDTTNCFVASYGTNDSTTAAGTVGMLEEARMVPVFLDGRTSQCLDHTTPSSYPTDPADETCYLAKGDGANCLASDGSAPVFCYTDTGTNEAVLMALTVPNQNCDETKKSFRAILL